jgi:thymidylate kinase
MPPGRFVVIEGNDGTGKSTLAARLGTEQFTTSVECPPGTLGSIKNEALSSLDPFARLLYFAAGNACLSALAAGVGGGRNLVGVRYIWSTLAYHSAIERTPVAVPFAMLKSIIPHLAMPEYVIFLTVQKGEQHERLMKRGELRKEMLQTEAEFQDRLSACYREAFELIPARVVTMDTTHTTVEDLAVVLQESLDAGIAAS